MKTIDIVIIEAGPDYTDRLKSFELEVSENESQAIEEAVKAVEAYGYKVIPNSEGGCCAYCSVSDGEDYIAITVEPNERRQHMMDIQRAIDTLRADIVARGGMCVSTDTTRGDHLIIAFSDFLRSYGIHCTLLDEAAEKIAIWEETDMRVYELCEEDRCLLEGLFDLLDAIAPEGFWFGAQVGDAACFGFWSIDID